MSEGDLPTAHFRKTAMKKSATLGASIKAPYVDAKKATIERKYVAWIDVMGSGAMMVRSLQNTLNFTLKLQAAALESSNTQVKVFPMNDGVFATSESLHALREFIPAVYARIVEANKQAMEKNEMHQVFLARAALAYGPVFDGSSITRSCSEILFQNKTLASRILIGPAVVNAYRGEAQTGPFGIYVHESARQYGPDNWSGSLMRYWDNRSWPTFIGPLKDHLKRYFEHVKGHVFELEYSLDALAKHRALAREFFDDETL